MQPGITLVSHALCPYVQRIAIALAEKGIGFDRRTVDLSNKPRWFLDISPLGRTPVLTIGDATLFESAAILEFLEDTLPHPLHPSDAVERARHRAWIGFGSECLGDIAAFYSAPDNATLEMKAAALHSRFRLLEAQLVHGPWFSGETFSLVDAVYAPVFRYLDTFDRIGDFGMLDGLDRTRTWRASLRRRPSVIDAVGRDYAGFLATFVLRRGGALSRLAAQRGMVMTALT